MNTKLKWLLITAVVVGLIAGNWIILRDLPSNLKLFNKDIYINHTQLGFVKAFDLDADICVMPTRLTLLAVNPQTLKLKLYDNGYSEYGNSTTKKYSIKEIKHTDCLNVRVSCQKTESKTCFNTKFLNDKYYIDYRVETHGTL